LTESQPAETAQPLIGLGSKPKGFEVQTRRWLVEWTFAWIFKNRRLVRSYEQVIAVAETLMATAASATLLCR
ncbi:IS5/IS1182 family transposase, partial [Xanthobacter autotrophicus ATCC 700551]